MNQSREAQAARLKMKRNALEYMERTMDEGDPPPSVALRHAELTRELAALERSMAGGGT